jgi:hypothetical protein
MDMQMFSIPLLAAIGYSIVYMLAGGGIVGAILIFVVAKLLGNQCRSWRL